MDNALQLTPRIRKESLSRTARELHYLAKQLKPRKAFSYRASDKGQAVFLLKHTREQRSVVKVSYAKNTKTRSWAAHGRYLQREHAQAKDRQGLGFSARDERIDLKETLHTWQTAGDERLFKVILSPEGAVDLVEHARELMREVERDLATQLTWVAIDHHNTEHPHVHILVRGVDEKGKGLTVDPTYIAEGFRHRSQEILTRKLGLRTEHDISLSRARQIEKAYVTELDRSLRFRSVDGIVNFNTTIPKKAVAKERRLQEIARLKYLEGIGLAEKIGDKLWRLSPNLEKTLKAMQLSNDIIKSRAQHGLAISDFPDLLGQSEIKAHQPITGKIVGMDLTPMSPQQNTPCSTLDSDSLTDWDRHLKLRARDGVVSFEDPIPYAHLERGRRLKAINRLKHLEAMGLAEKIGAKRWRLLPEWENTLLANAKGEKHPELPSALSPTVITQERPVTGQVVGMGLDNELHDRRYILIEGIDGKVHYVRATESIVKARDQFKFKNNDIVTLRLREFKPEEGEAVSYVHVENHKKIQDVLGQKVSVLDDAVIDYVLQNGRAPQINATSSFSRQFQEAMGERFGELKRQGLFIEEGEKVQLPEDYLTRLDAIQHGRFSNFVAWRPHVKASQKDLIVVGTVVASNERVMLVHDVRGEFYQVQNRDLGIENPLKVGREVYLRRHQIPKLEFTNTDKRLVSALVFEDYSPKKHRAALLAKLGQARFFLKNKEAVDSFVLAHQRRADTWVKWGFVAQEAGVYQVAPAMQNRLHKESLSLERAMQAHLTDLKEKYEKAVKECPCLFTVLTEKSVKQDIKRYVLLDRLLKEVEVPPAEKSSQIAKFLRARAVLWQSRGIALDGNFEKAARRWYADSQTLAQVAERIDKPLIVPMHSEPRPYSGKVVAMGSLNQSDVPHLMLETKTSVVALAMKPSLLRRYALKQEVNIKYKYQTILQEKSKKHKKSQEITINKGLSHG